MELPFRCLSPSCREPHKALCGGLPGRERVADKTRAYILIETAVGKTGEVTEQLRALNGMTAVDAVTGPFDIIAVAETETLNAIGDLISVGMHRIPGIVKTITCLSVSYSEQ